MQAAIGYLRVSTREQGRGGLGLAAQRFEIEAFGVPEGFVYGSHSWDHYLPSGNAVRAARRATA
jgi:DNA invertase Pin-like site-specific DNA recombinase